jgi:hypothetical protein
MIIRLMVEQAYYLSVPRFINSGEMLSGLFDEREENQTEELVWDTCFDDVFDALD